MFVYKSRRQTLEEINPIDILTSASRIVIHIDFHYLKLDSLLNFC